ncbi:ZIP family metal transporter [Ornithobacterium rhinotracheale]|uniref:ZIP family metal transporter n=1 Tax=Ornithobacterium rhinotracheale TaxID=28251 RepID=UPI0021594580|nr:ZIP family metal transporter [Ornithobacterium rhinotracheale]UVD86579.1 ZIP family metal transporter [Ornithobacterium rhinotracheale]
MEIIFLIVAVALGAALGLLLGSNKLLNKLLLTFSGAYLLGVNIAEVFPSLYTSDLAASKIGLFVLLGILIQIILEGITKGAEHGHLHSKDHEVFPISVFLGLFIHALIEGVPLQRPDGHSLLWAILIHKVPVAMVLFVFLSKSKLSSFKIGIFMLLFALASPIGYIVGNYLPPHLLTYALALAAGVFLHISTVIIFESVEGHKLKFKKLSMVVLGFLLAIIFSH